jgi:hypothetical protein
MQRTVVASTGATTSVAQKQRIRQPLKLHMEAVLVTMYNQRCLWLTTRTRSAGDLSCLSIATVTCDNHKRDAQQAIHASSRVLLQFTRRLASPGVGVQDANLLLQHWLSPLPRSAAVPLAVSCTAHWGVTMKTV